MMATLDGRKFLSISLALQPRRSWSMRVETVAEGGIFLTGESTLPD